MVIIEINCDNLRQSNMSDERKCMIRPNLPLVISEHDKDQTYCPDCPIGRRICSQSINVKSGFVVRVIG